MSCSPWAFPHSSSQAGDERRGLSGAASMADYNTDRTGQQLGNYRVLRLLGHGKFANVYLGEHIYLKSHAALKILHTNFTDEERAAFLKEAQTLMHLTHPHIVRILDFAVEGDLLFLVMEYLPGGTLRELHLVGTCLPLTTIMSYVQQVASALQYAHDQRLIHRDVKPENMLLDRHAEVVLSDFGLSVLDTPTYTPYTRHKMAQQVAGASRYLAPEQLQGKPQPASDQYALGIVVYEWLCGTPPFKGSLIEIAMQHLSMPPPPLRKLVPNLAPAIEQVVLRALEKEPDRRFVRVQDFSIALEQASQEALPHRTFSTSTIGSDTPQRAVKAEALWKVPPTFTSFVGREQEVMAICRLLKQPEVRLLTLVGTGGIGKTRLILQVATTLRDHFVDGVCFVPLAAISDAELVAPTIAQELSIQGSGAQPIIEQIQVALREKHVLVILDNFEQVLPAALLIEKLLVACPRLKVVVT